LISAIKQQAKSLYVEMKKVDWPSWEKVRSSSLSVAIVSLFVGLFLYGADRLISYGVSFILPHH
jgi:preprotein translocase subunit SecE